MSLHVENCNLTWNGDPRPLRERKHREEEHRTLPVAKRGSVLPLLPVLGALGSLIGGAAGIAKTVNENKIRRRELEELQRHNRAMEDRGLYLAPYKRGSGHYRRKRKKNFTGAFVRQS